MHYQGSWVGAALEKPPPYILLLVAKQLAQIHYVINIGRCGALDFKNGANRCLYY